jgi:hypothetical protein
LVPKFIPVTIAAGFIKCAEVTQAGFGPELAATFEPALLLAAGGFDCPGTDRPSSVCERLIVHPTGMGGKVVLFAPNRLARFTAALLELRNLAQDALFLTVPHLMAQGFDPLHECRFLFTM